MDDPEDERARLLRLEGMRREQEMVARRPIDLCGARRSAVGKILVLVLVVLGALYFLKVVSRSLGLG